MNLKLVESVPNISEGRDRSKIERIANAAVKAGAALLHLYTEPSTNRSVITLAGSPECIIDGTLALIREAAALIDMRNHVGTHPRMGSTDVCPFIPLKGVEMSDCVSIAKEVGVRASKELDIPVYLYGEAATSPERSALSYVRKGEYEGLAQRLNSGTLLPDFGQLTLGSLVGATAIGAREILVAFNVNLETKDSAIADKIAWLVRESGIPKKAKSEVLPTANPLIGLSAIGWFLESKGIAQVSTNIRNIRTAPPHEVVKRVSYFASLFGTRVTGAELVGLIPESCLVQAGYSAGANSADALKAGVKALGLEDFGPFNVEERTIEGRIRAVLKLNI